jgi:hypothetical protein
MYILAWQGEWRTNVAVLVDKAPLTYVDQKLPAPAVGMPALELKAVPTYQLLGVQYATVRPRRLVRVVVVIEVVIIIIVRFSLKEK